jgi:hypothetical protein
MKIISGNRRKNMLAWQSLDKEYRAWYVPYSGYFGKGWISDASAPTLFFGVARLHRTEEEAAKRVEGFYADFLRIRSRKKDL